MTSQRYEVSTVEQAAEVDHTVVVAIVRRGDELLLVGQRWAGAGDGGIAWCFPAGKLAPAEGAVEGLVREVAEETGLALRRLVRLAYAVHVVGPQPGHRSTVLVFEAEVEADGRLAPHDPDGDIVAAEFVRLPEAIARVGRVPSRFMSEPAVAYLTGRVRPGAVWCYRSDGHLDLVPGHS